MLRLMGRKRPEPNRYDREGRLRLMIPTVTYSAAMDAAFNQIRQYGGDSAAVMIRLLEAFALLARQSQCNDDREAVRKHAVSVLRTAERGSLDEVDLHSVRGRYDDVIKAFRDHESS